VKPIRRAATLALFLLAYNAVGSVTSVFAQDVQFNQGAADLKLRSNLRVNPSTHALEFNIPLGSYPGRAGAVPITIPIRQNSGELLISLMCLQTISTDSLTMVTQR
jgi:hypothetical protein